MQNLIDDAKAKAAEMFIYFSSLLERDVHDKDGESLGAIWDMSIKLGETYPKASELVIAKGFIKKEFASVPWSDVLTVEDEIVLAVKSKDLHFKPEPKEYEFLLKRDILDQQVVDTYNHKVRRVNDVHLLKVDHELVIAHVDIGLRGLARRLGWEKIIDLIIHFFAPRARYLTATELVSWKYVQPVALNPASMTMKLSLSQKQLQSIPAADLGEIIFDLNSNQRMALFSTLDAKTKSKVFENLEFAEQNAILRELDKKEAAQIVTHMSSDEATDLLERLPQSAVRNILTLIESSRAKKLSTLLGYSSDSAGGLMTTDFVSIPEQMSAEAAIEYIKSQPRDIDVAPYIYLVDEKNHLKGITTIRRLLLTDPKDSVSKNIFPKTLYVHLHDGMKEVAYIMDKYKISAIPVVDEHKILSGVITIDDVLSQVISIAWRKRPRASKGL
jgi:CBS domain-containing protein/sporulation protein YlmC with PRC-barrel domain